MKKNATLILALVILSINFSQAQRSNNVRVKSEQIKKMSTVILEKDGQKFPKSYLYRMTKDSISLITPVMERYNQDPIYCRKKLAFSDFDYLTVSNRSERLRFQLIGGLALGTLSYIVTRNATRGDINDEPNLILLGQRANSGKIEAALMGLTGFGLGILVGELLSEKKINLRRNQRRMVKDLKRYSYR